MNRNMRNMNVRYVVRFSRLKDNLINMKRSVKRKSKILTIEVSLLGSWVSLSGHPRPLKTVVTK